MAKKKRLKIRISSILSFSGPERGLLISGSFLKKGESSIDFTKSYVATIELYLKIEILFKLWCVIWNFCVYCGVVIRLVTWKLETGLQKLYNKIMKLNWSTIKTKSVLWRLTMKNVDLRTSFLYFGHVIFLREQGDLAQHLGPIINGCFIQELLIDLSRIMVIITTWILLKHDINLFKKFAVVKTTHKRSLRLTYFLKGATSRPPFFCSFIGFSFYQWYQFSA